jgi:hypothetical protein
MLAVSSAFENVINGQLTVVCGELNSEWKMDSEENLVPKGVDVPTSQMSLRKLDNRTRPVACANM